MFSHNFFGNDALKFTMNSRYMKKIPTSKISKVMKSTSKTKFNHYLLSNIFNDIKNLEDLILIFYI